MEMRKIAYLSSILGYLAYVKAAFAASPSPIVISPPPQGYKDLGAFVTNALTLAFIVAILVVLAMLVWGAFEWVTSGGDKDHVASARNRIINALVGLAVLAIAFALARLFGQFIGLDITNITVPTPP